MSEEQEFNLKLNQIEATILYCVLYELELAREARINQTIHRRGLPETINDLRWEKTVLTSLRERLSSLKNG